MVHFRKDFFFFFHLKVKFLKKEMLKSGLQKFICTLSPFYERQRLVLENFWVLWLPDDISSPSTHPI